MIGASRKKKVAGFKGRLSDSCFSWPTQYGHEWETGSRPVTKASIQLLECLGYQEHDSSINPWIAVHMGWWVRFLFIHCGIWIIGGPQWMVGLVPYGWSNHIVRWQTSEDQAKELWMPGLENTRLFISLTAGAGTVCMSLSSSSPTLTGWRR